MDKMNGNGLDLTTNNIEKIRRLFPECFSDGKINFEVLKCILGADVDSLNEKYSFNWIGKFDALKYSQMPSAATLIPLKEKSLNWSKTENLYLEGDNLEVLKTLSKTFHGNIKMIYIDPPYNTGKDFVYHDNFHDNVDNYLNSSNQSFKSNPETAGRYHTDWLNMIYPRIKLAYELLSDDGAIFISIDDNEVFNLKKVCDEIFDEKNFVTCLPRMTSAQRPSQEKYISIQHDYVLVYAKNSDSESGFARTIKRTGLDGVKKDDIGLYFEGDTSPILASSTQGYSKGGDYDFEYNGVMYKPVDKDGNRRRWLWTIERMQAAVKLGILVPTKNGLRVQNYINKEFQLKTNIMVDKDPNLILASYDFMDPRYANNHGTSALTKIGLDFSFSKPVNLLKEIIKLIPGEDFYVMDFFSGSATTAEAVMSLNSEDGRQRKFIMVQLPEKNDIEESMAEYESICDLGEERIRRSGKKILEEQAKKISGAGLFADELIKPDKLDIGFKVFRLDTTNIKPWDSTIKYDENSILNLNNVIKEGRSNLDVAYEVMLKYGVFNMPLEEIQCNGKTVYSVGSNYMIISLNDEITAEDVAAIAKLQPKAVVFKESGFEDDNAKMNADYTFKRLGIDNVKCI